MRQAGLESNPAQPDEPRQPEVPAPELAKLAQQPAELAPNWPTSRQTGAQHCTHLPTGAQALSSPKTRPKARPRQNVCSRRRARQRAARTGVSGARFSGAPREARELPERQPTAEASRAERRAQANGHGAMPGARGARGAEALQRLARGRVPDDEAAAAVAGDDGVPAGRQRDVGDVKRAERLPHGPGGVSAGDVRASSGTRALPNPELTTIAQHPPTWANTCQARATIHRCGPCVGQIWSEMAVQTALGFGRVWGATPFWHPKEVGRVVLCERREDRSEGIFSPARRA